MAFDAAAVAHAYAIGAEDYARKFGDQFQTNDFDRQILTRLVERCSPRSRVLDVGCGPGQVSAYVNAHDRAAVGIDLTPEMLVAARRGDRALPLLNGDMLRLPLRDACCDAAVCWYSVHNMARSALPSALCELRRVLRTGGHLLVATHSGDGEEWHETEWNGRVERVVVTYYLPDELAGLLRAAGYRDLDISTRPPLPEEHQVEKVYAAATAV
jgi:ubiquinone/menaquinone biosynthesis C-methylase UbiE